MNLSLRFVLLAAAVVPIGLNLPSYGSETSETFQGALSKACEAQETPEICSCYSKKVTSQYNDNQLVAIFNLLKDTEANDMFLVIHSQIGMDCKNSTIED